MENKKSELEQINVQVTELNKKVADLETAKKLVYMAAVILGLSGGGIGVLLGKAYGRVDDLEGRVQKLNTEAGTLRAGLVKVAEETNFDKIKAAVDANAKRLHEAFEERKTALVVVGGLQEASLRSGAEREVDNAAAKLGVVSTKAVGSHTGWVSLGNATLLWGLEGSNGPQAPGVPQLCTPVVFKQNQQLLKYLSPPVIFVSPVNKSTQPALPIKVEVQVDDKDHSSKAFSWCSAQRGVEIQWLAVGGPVCVVGSPGCS